jgi:hypothetical protein
LGAKTIHDVSDEDLAAMEKKLIAARDSKKQ